MYILHKKESCIFLKLHVRFLFFYLKTLFDVSAKEIKILIKKKISSSTLSRYYSLTPLTYEDKQMDNII